MNLGRLGHQEPSRSGHQVNTIREVFWFTLFLWIGIAGCVVAIVADAAAWCEEKLRDALNAIEEHLE
jgi:hypothetical protein